MAIHTSSNTYRRGIPNNYNNFFFVAQTNNAIPRPMGMYLRGHQFYNRNIINPSKYRWLWKP
jgi:hypothetical protein